MIFFIFLIQLLNSKIYMLFSFLTNFHHESDKKQADLEDIQSYKNVLNLINKSKSPIIYASFIKFIF